jgi:hypothetical protein
MLAAALGACGDDGGPPKNPEATFPKAFLWGTAVAGFQSDPGCPTLPPEQCEDRASDWYQWVSDPELIADSSTFVTGEPLANGPGMRELYAEDLGRAKNELTSWRRTRTPTASRTTRRCSPRSGASGSPRW